MIIKSVSRVDQLKARVERTKEDLEQKRELERRLAERDKLIDEAPTITYKEFYCSCCGDFTSRAGKVEFLDEYGRRCAYYVSFGRGIEIGGRRKGKRINKVCRVKRYITDKHIDPYYLESEMLRFQRQMYAKDLLQPGDPGFRTLYGDPNKALYEQMEEEERAEWEIKNNRF